jgi:hypothetical protein
VISKYFIIIIIIIRNFIYVFKLDQYIYDLFMQEVGMQRRVRPVKDSTR